MLNNETKKWLWSIEWSQSIVWFPSQIKEEESPWCRTQSLVFVASNRTKKQLFLEEIAIEQLIKSPICTRDHRVRFHRIKSASRLARLLDQRRNTHMNHVFTQ